MSIQLTTPDAPKPGKTHSTIVSMTIRGLTLPAGWSVPPQFAESLAVSRSHINVVIADAVKNGPGDFTLVGIREESFGGAVVAALLFTEGQKLRGLRRVLEDLIVAQGNIVGTASND